MVNINGTFATPRADLGEALQEYTPSAVNYIATQVLPLLPTQKQAATFSRHTREGLLKSVDAKRTKRSAYNRAQTETEDDSYTCEEFGIEDLLDDSEREFFASDFDAEEATTMSIANKMWIQQEKRAKAVVFDTAIWTGAPLFTDVTTVWSDIASDIIGDINAATQKVKDGSGLRPNAAILNFENLQNMLKNTAIIARFPGAEVVTRRMIEDNLAAIFGLERLIVGDASEDTADEGLATTIGSIWGATNVMVAKVCNEGDRIVEPCIGRSFLWVADSPDNQTVEQYREEQTRSDVFRVRQNIDEKRLITELGHLLKVD